MSASAVASAAVSSATKGSVVPAKGAAAALLRTKHPARTPADAWRASRGSMEETINRTNDPALKEAGNDARRTGARWLLKWLATFPGDSWQDRWRASPAADNPRTWHRIAQDWVAQTRRGTRAAPLQAGLLGLLGADAIRPTTDWIVVNTSQYFRLSIIRNRDPAGFARLAATVAENRWSSYEGYAAQTQLAVIIAAKGGGIGDITLGDMLELVDACSDAALPAGPVMAAYEWLHTAGMLPPDAPTSLRMIRVRTTRLTPTQLVDRHGLRRGSVRTALIEYLTERQPALDYASLDDLARTLAWRFWADIEQHHPGIETLDLPPHVVAGWKKRIQTKTKKVTQPDGTVTQITSARDNAPSILSQVRAFYLDLVEWASDDPARWAQWAVRSPIGAREIQFNKALAQRKARSNQRTRERLPSLPVLVDVANRRLVQARERLEAARAAAPGARFAVLGETFTKARKSAWGTGQRAAIVFDEQGVRSDQRVAENHAFWAWATIEFLRHTGARIEEMLEISHHSLVQYRLPTTGQIVPLLQIAPSKTDEERMVLVSPELADVLSAIVSRVRDKSGTIPLVSAWDTAEKVWNPPMPLLFQWRNGDRPPHPVNRNLVRKILAETLEASGLTDSAGRPLSYQPHDFRRLFVTDAILNGLPPHIAQVIVGHKDINTTMGYNTVYPAAVIESHRAFIARRRATRPSEEYRTPTEEEWEAFLGHFERRKLSLGTCGRAYGTGCAHEHACIRCPVLRPDDRDRHRLVEIRDNLTARITEAEREGWLGEVEGLTVSLHAAKEKIAQLDTAMARRSSAVHLGMPTYVQIAGRASATPGP
jgi:hypothetical protein